MRLSREEQVHDADEGAVGRTDGRLQHAAGDGEAVLADAPAHDLTPVDSPCNGGSPERGMRL